MGFNWLDTIEERPLVQRFEVKLPSSRMDPELTLTQ